MFGDQG